MRKQTAEAANRDSVQSVGRWFNAHSARTHTHKHSHAIRTHTLPFCQLIQLHTRIYLIFIAFTPFCMLLVVRVEACGLGGDPILYTK